MFEIWLYKSCRNFSHLYIYAPISLFRWTLSVIIGPVQCPPYTHTDQFCFFLSNRTADLGRCRLVWCVCFFVVVYLYVLKNRSPALPLPLTVHRHLSPAHRLPSSVTRDCSRRHGFYIHVYTNLCIYLFMIIICLFFVIKIIFLISWPAPYCVLYLFYVVL